MTTNFLDLNQDRWVEIKGKITSYLKSGVLPPHIRSAEQAMTIAAKGAELGVSPIYALTHINMIKGRAAISSELMLALILKKIKTASIVYAEHDDKKCIIKARRNPNDEYSQFSFTIEDAKRAGLLGKDNWRNYPQDMLRARAISQMCRGLFPDAIAGCSYTPDELGADESPNEKAQKIVNDIEIEVEQVQANKNESLEALEQIK